MCKSSKACHSASISAAGRASFGMMGRKDRGGSFRTIRCKLWRSMCESRPPRDHPMRHSKRTIPTTIHSPSSRPLQLKFIPVQRPRTRSTPLIEPSRWLAGHPSCDLRLLDVTIGYFQCALVNTSDGVWLVDTMSRKGAILNGRGTRLARVRDGDLLELGRMSLVMRIGSHHCNQLALRNSSPAGARHRRRRDDLHRRRRVTDRCDSPDR